MNWHRRLKEARKVKIRKQSDILSENLSRSERAVSKACRLSLATASLWCGVAIVLQTADSERERCEAPRKKQRASNSHQLDLAQGHGSHKLNFSFPWLEFYSIQTGTFKDFSWDPDSYKCTFKKNFWEPFLTASCLGIFSGIFAKVSKGDNRLFVYLLQTPRPRSGLVIDTC